MQWWQSVILGIVQGVTEFLPISSSAHLQLANFLMMVRLTPTQMTAYIATIQLGTEAAVLLYFFKDVVRILGAWFKTGFTRKPSQDGKLGWFVIIGSLPVVIVGLAFKGPIEELHGLQFLKFAGYTLIVFGILLFIADIVGKKTKPIEKLTVGSAIAFGIGQMLAVIPGVSRSGGTLTAGLFMGFDRKAAARYSFLLAIPAVLASGLYEFITTYKDLPEGGVIDIAIGTVVSFVVGYAVIAGFLRYITNHALWPLVVYRVLAGIGFIVIANLGVSPFQ